MLSYLAIATIAVIITAWAYERMLHADNRCIGDLGGEGLTPEPTSLPYAPHIEAAIDEALMLGLIDQMEEQFRGAES